MKSREEISAALSNSLTSAAWLQLKHSLIGKELISLGTEIIYRSALTQEAFTAGMDYQNCDFCDLCGLGRRNNIAVSDCEPSYATLNVTSAKKPYDTVLSVGSVAFLSTEFAGAGTTVTGYEGIVRELYAVNSFGLYTAEGAIATGDSLKVDINGHSYIRLGRQVLPKSVRFYVNLNGTVTEMPLYNPTLYGTEGYVKVITLEDGCVAIEIPNDTASWSDWSCYFIDLTYTDFDISSQSGILDMYVGRADNLEYARNQYAIEMANFYVISSESDILDYIRKHEGVVDARILTDADTRTVQVYIKPNSGSSVTNFSNLRYDLTLHSNLFTDYVVSGGTPVSFQFLISGAESYEQPEIENIVRGMYKYEDMRYDTPVVAADVTSKVFSELGLRVSVTLKVIEDNIKIGADGSYSMSMVPTAGSLRVIDSTPSIRAWDKWGVMYAIDDTSHIQFDVADVIGSFGRAAIIYSSPDYYIYDTDNGYNVNITSEITEMTDSESIDHPLVWINSSTNPMFVCNGKLYVLYDSLYWSAPSQSTPVFALMFSTTYSSTSLFNYVSGAYDETYGFRQTAVVLNGVVYSFTDSDGLLTMYRISGTQQYSAISLGAFYSVLKSAILLEGKIVLIGVDGSVFEVQSGVSYILMNLVYNWDTESSTSNYDVLFYKNYGCVVYSDSTASFKGVAILSSPIINGRVISFKEKSLPFTPAEGSEVKAFSSCLGKVVIYSSGESSSVAAYQGGGLWTMQSTEEADRIHCYDSVVIGTVDYERALLELSYGNGIGGMSLHYKALQSVVGSVEDYFVLNNNEPIVWQE